MDLDRFFDQWLFYEYYPEYRYKWDVIKTADQVYKVDITIAQLQTSVVYEMPIELVILFSGGRDTSITVNNNLDSQKYSFTFSEEPISMLFDPDQWILCHAEPMRDQEFTNNLEILKIGPNPFPTAASSIINIEILNWVEDELIMDIFDILGRKVNVLKSTRKDEYTSRFTWNGTDQHGNKVASGVYFIRARNKKNDNLKLGKARKIFYFNN